MIAANRQRAVADDQSLSFIVYIPGSDGGIIREDDGMNRYKGGRTKGRAQQR